MRRWGPAAFALHRLLVDKDVRETIREVLHMQLLDYVASGNTQGVAASMVLSGDADVAAAVQAQKLVPDRTYGSAMRAHL